MFDLESMKTRMKTISMNNKYNLGSFICLLAGVLCMYHMLLNDKALPWSINAVELSLNHWLKHWHVLVVGLMPIYVSFALFGAAIGSLSVGSRLQYWLTHACHKDKNPDFVRE